MKKTRHFSAPRQDELCERLEILLTAIHQFFQAQNILRHHLWHVLERLSRRSRKNAPDVEQFVLHPTQLVFELLGRRGFLFHVGVDYPHHTDRRIEFIDRPIRFDAQTIFPDLLPARQSGFSRVSCSRVDLRNPHHRFPLRAVTVLPQDS